MVINLPKFFFQTQSFFIAGNEKQIIFLLAKTESRERKSLNLKRSSKTFNQYTKAISNYIYRLYHSVICFHSTLLSNRLPPRGILGLQCIWSTQLIIHTTLLPYCFHCHYVTSFLAYCKW